MSIKLLLMFQQMKVLQNKIGCPKADLGKLADLIDEHKAIFVPILCILGLVFALFGQRMIKFTLFMSGMFLGAAVVLVVIVLFSYSLLNLSLIRSPQNLPLGSVYSRLLCLDFSEDTSLSSYPNQECLQSGPGSDISSL